MLSPDQVADFRTWPDPKYVGRLPARSGPTDATDLILKCNLCPGDTVLMTGALRDLHRAYPGRFRTAAETTAMELWENNPNVTEARFLSPQAATINWGWTTENTNERPRHLLQVWADSLADRIGVERFPVTEFRGDIHLSEEEKQQPIEQVARTGGPYWVIMPCGKKDCQTKLWPVENWQPVVDHFFGRIHFVQCGATDELVAHANLMNVTDLRGKTTVRQFLKVIHHAAGVVCPITFAMHLAAAVPTSLGRGLRPCVVVAGGREPAHLINYPGHTVLHRIGRLPCTRGGSCWKDFTTDGPGHHPHQKCLDPQNGYARCMREITPEEVCRAIEGYL